MARRYFGQAGSENSSPDITPFGSEEGQGLAKAFNFMPQVDLAGARKYQLIQEMDKLKQEAAEKDKLAKMAAAKEFELPIDAHHTDISAANQQLGTKIQDTLSRFRTDPVVQRYVSQLSDSRYGNPIDNAEGRAAYGKLRAELGQHQNEANVLKQRKLLKSQYEENKLKHQNIQNPEMEKYLSEAYKYGQNQPAPSAGQYVEFEKAREHLLKQVAQSATTDEANTAWTRRMQQIPQEALAKGIDPSMYQQIERTKFEKDRAKQLLKNWYENNPYNSFSVNAQAPPEIVAKGAQAVHDWKKEQFAESNANDFTINKQKLAPFQDNDFSAREHAASLDIMKHAANRKTDEQNTNQWQSSTHMGKGTGEAISIIKTWFGDLPVKRDMKVAEYGGQYRYLHPKEQNKLHAAVSGGKLESLNQSGKKLIDEYYRTGGQPLKGFKTNEQVFYLDGIGEGAQILTESEIRKRLNNGQQIYPKVYLGIEVPSSDDLKKQIQLIETEHPKATSTVITSGGKSVVSFTWTDEGTSEIKTKTIPIGDTEMIYEPIPGAVAPPYKSGTPVTVPTGGSDTRKANIDVTGNTPASTGNKKGKLDNKYQ